MTDLKYVYQNDEVMIFKTDYDETYLVVEKEDEFSYYLEFDRIKRVYKDFRG